MKRQPIEWEKISASNVTDKGLVSKIYEQHIQLSTKKKKNPFKKNGLNILMDISPKETYKDFRGSPVVKTLCSHCSGMSLIPGQE